MDWLLQIIIDVAVNTWLLAVEAAPWLLLGLLAAGLIKAYVPDRLLGRWVGGGGVWPVVRAALIGIPLPLCSCGVIPAAMGLRRQGASRGATVSFLIATPETGVDSIAISYALLGPFFTILRPISAVITAVSAGLASQWLGRDRLLAPVVTASDTCCGPDGCCDAEPTATVEASAGRLAAAGRSVIELLDDLALWLTVGLVLAGIMATAVEPSSLSSWAGGMGAMLLMLVIGIPMYICATASTPLAAAMLIAGVSPGAVLVFLLAGPATNISTLVIVGRELGKTVAITYLTVLSLCTILLGLATEKMINFWQIDLQAEVAQATGLVPTWLAIACLIGLVVLTVRPLRRLIFR